MARSTASEAEGFMANARRITLRFLTDKDFRHGRAAGQRASREAYWAEIHEAATEAIQELAKIQELAEAEQHRIRKENP